jgi:hypothetical protein
MLQWPFGAALSRQLRAMAEFAEALKQAANLRRGIWQPAPGVGQ